MNWMKAIVAGVVGAVVVTVYNFVMHGMIMASTYTKYPVFAREQANPLFFLLVAVMMSIPAALLFARSRTSWAAGVMGGVTFGFWLGLVSFFAQFYFPLSIAGFPYHLAWCWGGITLGGWLVFGAVAGALYKQAPTP